METAAETDQDIGVTLLEFAAWRARQVPPPKPRFKLVGKSFGILLYGEKNGKEVIIGAAGGNAEEATKSVMELWEKA
jgi:hypothetical protein